jgi:hypothetical protein
MITSGRRWGGSFLKSSVRARPAQALDNPTSKGTQLVCQGGWIVWSQPGPARSPRPPSQGAGGFGAKAGKKPPEKSPAAGWLTGQSLGGRAKEARSVQEASKTHAEPIQNWHREEERRGGETACLLGRLSWCLARYIAHIIEEELSGSVI